MLVANNSIGKDAWLKAFSKSTKKVYRIGYEKFIRFMNETEEGNWGDKRLLTQRDVDLEHKNYAFEQKLVEFRRWLDTIPDKPSDNSKKSYVGAICSFFAFHRMDLKFTKQQRNIIYKRAKPSRKYYEFTVEDLRRMSEVAKPKEKYVLLAGKSLGLRASDFIRLEQGLFEARMKGEPPISIGEIYTIKEGVKASPFLDEDAVEASRTWLQILESRGRRDPNARMIDITEQELTIILKKLVKQAEINIGNELIRFHSLRVFLCTRLSSVTSESRWKQVVGKKVPESAYVKPFLLRKDYAKVLPLIMVRKKVTQDEARKLREELKTLRESENIAQSEVEIIKDKMKILKKQFKELQEEVRKLSRKEYYSLSEAFGEPVRGKEADLALEEIEGE